MPVVGDTTNRGLRRFSLETRLYQSAKSETKATRFRDLLLERKEEEEEDENTKGYSE
jgi:hypothetical protein